MSLATLKGEGNGGIVLHKLRYRKEHRHPYLQRNIRRSLRSLVMGSALSSFKTPSGSRSRDEVVWPSDEEEEEDPRPAKRRRASMFEAAASRNEGEFGSRRLFDQVTIEKTRGPRTSGKIQPVQPSDFYGKSRTAHMKPELPKRADFKPKTPKSSIDEEIIPRTPTNFKKALRLHITSVVRKSLSDDESTAFMRGRRSLDVIDIKCRCSVALFSGKNDENPQVPITQKDYQEVFRKSSNCILRTTINDGGEVVRELVDLKPFDVPQDEMFVTRKKRNHRGQFTHSWGFAEEYYVSITLEPAGLQKEWPPFDPSSLTNSDDSTNSNPVTDLLENTKVTKNDLYLIARMKNLFEPSRQTKSAPLKLSHGSLRQEIPYALKFAIKWSLPSHLSDLPTTNIKSGTGSAQSKSKVAVAPTATRTLPGSPSPRKGKDVQAPESPAENRARRPRSNVTTYNVKALSAIQQGKSPRLSKSTDIRSRSAPENSEDTEGVIVTYTFGKAHSADFWIQRETTMMGLVCPLCRYSYSSLDDLRLHLHTNHSAYKFSLRRSNDHRIGFCVDIAKQGPRGSPRPLAEQARTFQLSQPRTLLDLEKFLNGDESWVKSREGPQHNLWPEHLQDHFHESSLSSSSHESRQSSPNTSNDTDDVMDLENYHPKLSIRPRRKFLVPKTSKPLYDTITKQILEPGTEIPNSDDEKDEGWLHQKHRDIIMDYGDVTDDEKDYIIRWNPCIMGEQLTCETHLGDAVVRFVEANKFWFSQRASRKREFGKTMETFLMRGVVDAKCFAKCIAILKRAEKLEGSKEKEVTEVETPVSPAKQRGALDCECGGHTQPPDRVVCRGEVSLPGCQIFNIHLLTESFRTAQRDSTIANVQKNQDDQSEGGGYAIIAFLKAFQKVSGRCCMVH